MAQYAGGADFERAMKKYFEREGYYCVRSAGSKGKVDLVLLNRDSIVLIQCKKERKGSKRKSYKKDIEELESVPATYDVVKVLCVKRSVGKRTFVEMLASYSNHSSSIEIEWSEVIR